MMMATVSWPPVAAIFTDTRIQDTITTAETQPIL